MEKQETNWTTPSMDFPDEELRRQVESLPIGLLIAEDDPTIRQMLKRSLSNERYDIIEAEDGEQAWEALQNEENPPRLALIDWMMPKIDGLTLCQKIKARKNPFVFTIMLTAKTRDEDVVIGLRAGADEFLTKPFHVDVLRSRVAAGARIVRLEKMLSMKNSILEYYIEKVEKLAAERARLLKEKDS